MQHEAIAGITACVEYLADLGRAVGNDHVSEDSRPRPVRRAKLDQ